MTRPLYETAEQREANAKLADYWGEKMGYQLDISPKACLFDYYVRTPLNQWGSVSYTHLTLPTIYSV